MPPYILPPVSTPTGSALSNSMRHVPYSTSITWHPCPPHVPEIYNCARVLSQDYASAHQSAHIPNYSILHLSRLPATVPEDDPSWLGPLLLDPTSDGESGVQLVWDHGEQLRDATGGLYTLVGVDTRAGWPDQDPKWEPEGEARRGLKELEKVKAKLKPDGKDAGLLALPGWDYMNRSALNKRDVVGGGVDGKEAVVQEKKKEETVVGGVSQDASFAPSTGGNTVNWNWRAESPSVQKMIQPSPFEAPIVRSTPTDPESFKQFEKGWYDFLNHRPYPITPSAPSPSSSSSAFGVVKEGIQKETWYDTYLSRPSQVASIVSAPASFQQPLASDSASPELPSASPTTVHTDHDHYEIHTSPSSPSSSPIDTPSSSPIETPHSNSDPYPFLAPYHSSTTLPYAIPAIHSSPFSSRIPTYDDAPPLLSKDPLSTTSIYETLHAPSTSFLAHQRALVAADDAYAKLLAATADYYEAVRKVDAFRAPWDSWSPGRVTGGLRKGMAGDQRVVEEFMSGDGGEVDGFGEVTGENLGGDEAVVGEEKEGLQQQQQEGEVKGDEEETGGGLRPLKVKKKDWGVLTGEKAPLDQGAGGEQ